MPCLEFADAMPKAVMESFVPSHLKVLAEHIQIRQYHTKFDTRVTTNGIECPNFWQMIFSYIAWRGLVRMGDGLQGYL